MKALIIGILIAAALLAHQAKGQIDHNGNQQSDVWEMRYNAHGLSAGADDDGDGMTNETEAEAGTDPLNAASIFKFMHTGVSGNMLTLDWLGADGKVYHLEHSTTLGDDWTIIATYTGQEAAQAALVDFGAYPGFYRLVVQDLDSDGDGVSDWEELMLGFDPTTANTQYYSQNDLTRIQNLLTGSNSITAVALQSQIAEDWNAPGVILIQRRGALDPITVNVSIGGTAIAGLDYVAVPATVDFALGQIAAWLPITPIADDDIEGNESLTLILLPGTGYSVGTPSSATITIIDSDTSALPTAREAARFLGQATFGPTPALITEVQVMGFEAWIDDQFSQPVGEHTPYFLTFPWGDGEGEIAGPYAFHKMLAWWENAMNAPDPLRQRVAFALSEILVISDTNGGLEGNPIGMLTYYDMLLANAFGNYRDLLEDVTYHPCMGVFLSHRGNLPADPSINRFPDENYAREVMQLFSIGLWQLNNDGSRILNNGQPIPTYDNNDITNLASVFTGMSWGQGDTGVWWEFFWPDTTDEYWQYYTVPMAVWEGPYNVWNSELGQNEIQYYHEQSAKTVLGVNLPGNDPLSPEANYAENDIGRALDVIFNHPNVGPFIGKLLIQRLVKSNPSPAYISRVADAFNGTGPYNPSGVRGDMQSVIRAILLDPDARDADMISDPHHGMLRENYLRYVGLARAFNASSTSGNYPIFWVNGQFGQQPLSSPSVFNFFSPEYQPLGDIRNAGLVAPEFQILTAVTGITIPNQLRTGIETRLNWPENPDDYVTLDTTPATALASDPDALIEYLDILLCFGNMSPQLHQTLREMLDRPEFSGASDQFVVNSLLYIITMSADSAVLK